MLTVAANGSELSLHWPSGDISPLIFMGPDHYMDRSYWEEVSIERDATDGNAKSMVYDRFRGSAKGK